MTERNDDAATATVRPMYLQIREDLMQDLREKRSSRLPSEREICQKYGVCRPTVHKALSYFIEKNMIVRRPGKGTFFRDNVLHDEPETSRIKIVIRRDWQTWEGDSYFGQAVQGVFGALSHLPLSVGIEKYSEKLKYDLLQDSETVSIWLSPERDEVAAIAELTDADRTAVALNRYVSHPGVYWVSSDHEDEGYQACEYLLRMGHTRLTYFCSEAELSIFHARERGIRRLLPPEIHYRAAIFPADDWRRNFELRAERAIDEAAAPEAWIVNNGSLLNELFELVARRGGRIPDDFSLITFGDGADAEKLGVAVIRQQVEKLGRLAAAIAAGDLPATPGTLLPCELIERNSVKKL